MKVKITITGVKPEGETILVLDYHFADSATPEHLEKVYAGLVKDLELTGWTNVNVQGTQE